MRNLRYRVIFKYIGGVFLVLAGAFFLVAVVSLSLGEWNFMPGWFLVGASR